MLCKYKDDPPTTHHISGLPSHPRRFPRALALCPPGVPSGPRNVISIVNETSVILEWHSPRETGGREDVVYNIVCKKCRSDRRSCSHCDDNVDFLPRQLGLTDTRVLISNLLAHTLYSFEIQAVNGVSNRSPYPAQHVSIDITTNQAGKDAGPLHLNPFCCCCCCCCQGDFICIVTFIIVTVSKVLWRAVLYNIPLTLWP